MTSKQFLQAAEQLNLLRECVSTSITDKDKVEKIDTVNEYIKSLSETVLHTYIDDSTLILYKNNGKEYIDIWSDRENMMYCLRNYGGYLNINWDDFHKKFKHIFDFSRYKPNKNPYIITYCDN